MDLTFEVMLPPRGTTDWTVSCNPTVRVLAPVAIYERKVLDVVGMRCTGYVHCADVPEHQTWPAEWTLARKVQHMNAVLTEAWLDDTFAYVEKRQWAGNASALNTPQRRALEQSRQVEVPWSVVRNLWRNQKRNAGFTEADFAWPLSSDT